MPPKKVENLDFELQRLKKFNEGIPKQKKEKREQEFSENYDAEIGDAKATQLAKTYHFQTYDLNKIPLDAAILVVGKRRYGKTTFTDDLLSHRWMYYPDGGYCFTRTKFNYFWHQRFPETRIYEGMDWDVIFAILQEQKKKVEKIIYEGEEEGEESIPYVVIVLDDIIADQHDMRYEELLLELMFSGRHYRVTIIINVQDIKGVAPSTRQNFDIIACTYQTQERQIEQIKNDFGDFFPNKKVFREVMKLNTQDHQMLIIDQTVAKYRVEDVFFVYKAQEHPEDYHIGDEDFWKQSGCVWEDQLKLYKNIPKRDLEEWWKIAARRWTEEFVNKKKNEDDAEEDDVRKIIVTRNRELKNPYPYKSNKERADEIIQSLNL